jgi:PhzF family phenazine biosynthesis protein
MKLKIYQVDAFTDKIFKGNPASVCPLDTWLSDEILQNIALENNQSETAFMVRKEDRIEIRWFTPTVEVDLCGHATVASAHVAKIHLGYREEVLPFYSPRSGWLPVTEKEGLYTLDFPSDFIHEIEFVSSYKDLFSENPIKVYKGKVDLIFEFETESQVKNLIPNLNEIKKIPVRGIIVTSKGEKYDFVSRFFGPASGIDEDPVTGSAHTSLIPFWSKILGKKNLLAYQHSKRGGELICVWAHERCLISGKAITYMQGEITI